MTVKTNGIHVSKACTAFMTISCTCLGWQDKYRIHKFLMACRHCHSDMKPICKSTATVFRQGQHLISLPKSSLCHATAFLGHTHPFRLHSVTFCGNEVSKKWNAFHFGWLSLLEPPRNNWTHSFQWIHQCSSKSAREACYLRHAHLFLARKTFFCNSRGQVNWMRLNDGAAAMNRLYVHRLCSCYFIIIQRNGTSFKCITRQQQQQQQQQKQQQQQQHSPNQISKQMNFCGSMKRIWS